MKYYSRCELYKGSNFTFDANRLTAHSYDWWQFVARIGRKVVFNDYNYSNTTRQHQRKVRKQMRELGIRIDRVVQVRRGLQNITTIKELNTQENETLAEIAQHQNAKRVRRNERARERRILKKNSGLETKEAHAVIAKATDSDGVF